MRLIRLLKKDIAKEAAGWVDSKIITEPQAEKICEQYNIDYHQVESSTFAYNMLITLGLFFVGLALITLLGANWDEIPRAIRMIGVVLLTVFTQLFAVKEYVANKHGKAVGIFFLGNMFFGASIILIAQIYHLGEHMPDGVLWWALGCLPIAIILKNTWLTLQTIVLAIVWFFLEVKMGFYPTLFPIFIAACVYVLFKGHHSTLLLVFTLGCIGFWLEYTLAEIWRESYRYKFQAEHFVVSVAMFILVYALAHWLNVKNSVKAKDYAAILSVWCLRFSLLIMLVMSFDWCWEGLILANWDRLPSMFALVVVFLSVALWLSIKAQKLFTTVFIGVFFLLSLFGVLLVNVYFSDLRNEAAVYFQIIYNLMLIVIGAGLIIKGIQEGITHYFYFGIIVIISLALIRYAELIGDYVGGAILFMFFAMILIGAAKYWKHHNSKEVIV